MLKVIFACVHNAGRSQMAAAFLNQLSNPHKAKAVSAGTEPGQRGAFRGAGRDAGSRHRLSHAEPQKLTEDLAKDARLLITMGCGDRCPYVPGLRRDDGPLRDPKGLSSEEVRSIRDEVRARVQSLIASENLS